MTATSGCVSIALSDCLLAIRSLSNDLPIRPSVEDAAEPRADDLMIVGNQDAGQWSSTSPPTKTYLHNLQDTE